jgi:hypothetical protein
MRREKEYLQRRVRVVAWIVLVGLLVFYTWFAFRNDGRLMTVPGVPHAVWFYFDHHANIRNGVGFLILGAVGAAAVTGLRPRWQVWALGLALAAPVLKDFAQDLFAPTRHFNWDATGLGTLGALVGWGATAVLLRVVNAK